MSASHIALLRGINVGKAKRVAMADLRALLGRLGYLEVKTLLNSGNVVFTVPRGIRRDHAGHIEQAIASRLGVSCRVFVLTAEALEAIVRANPLGDVADDPSRLLVSILARPADRTRLQPLTRGRWHPEAFALGPGASYLWCAGGILASPLAKAVNTALGDATTARNWATILKLKAIVSEDG